MNGNPNYGVTYYTPPPQFSPPRSSGNGMATASLVLGISGLLLSCCCGVGGILGLVGLILAIVSRSGSPDGRMNGAAIAGLILSILTLLMGVLSVVAVILSNLGVIAIPFLAILEEGLGGDVFDEIFREMERSMSLAALSVF